ncbi:uncharacterized protein LOC132162289 [Corylus avellana]|uniref:uncharacterized protein LOC132162289 n=1 Tax=Corylus avellana TaxID=13451 RepID=UPI00286A87B4|nr:uncharacterized protein LOC132162289 [Corylus avellana]
MVLVESLQTSSAIDLSKTKPHKYGPSSSDDFPSTEKEGSGEELSSSNSLKQAVEHIDNEERTILHVAIKYRQLEVFELVSNMEVVMRWMIRRIDNKGNTILHMVGIKREDYVPEKLRGPAFELQDELIWFERVKAVTKAHFIDHRNNEKQTAEGLFANTYKDLRNEAKVLVLVLA